MGPIMENGEPEFGYRDMSGPLEVHLPTELMREASAEIELLERQRAELFEALKFCASRLTLLINSGRHKMLDAAAEQQAREAIAKVQS